MKLMPEADCQGSELSERHGDDYDQITGPEFQFGKADAGRLAETHS